MATYRTILTNKGLQLEAASSAAGVPIVLTDMAVGDGNGNPVTPNPAQTTLARERYRHAVNRLVVMPDDPTVFLAELIIPADIGGFTIREVGLYTNNGDMFAVANVPNAYKPTDAEGSFGDTVIKMMFKVTNASVVTIVFDPNVTVATHTWVQNNVNMATMIPGGLTNQYLAKRSNADGDTIWKDPTEGITVIVFSREETQTLAAGQKVIDLAEITAEGAAIYIEGTRLRADEFSQTGATQITLASSHPAGTKVTAVQNEEVGTTDVLLRPLNLSDVPDKSQARLNLGLPNWLATSSINWSQLVNVPDTAVRWPKWDEVTDKPTTFAPSAHTHAWAQITGAPETATRWPSWTEVTSKPSLFPPSAHSHAEYVLKAGDTVDGPLTVRAAGATNPGIRLFPRQSGGTLNRTCLDAVSGDGSTFTELHTYANGWRFFNPTTLEVVTITSGGAITAASKIKGSGAFDPNNPQGSGLMSSGSYGGGLAMEDGVHHAYFYTAAGDTIFGRIRNGNSGVATQLFAASTNGFAATGGFDFGSSRKLKDIDGPVEYGLAVVERMELAAGRYKPEYNGDGRRRLFFVAEQLAELVPEAVNMEGVEFNGERVPSIKLDQLLPVMAKAIQELAAEVRALKAGR